MSLFNLYITNKEKTTAPVINNLLQVYIIQTAIIMTCL